jgi:hypothetical protein
MAQKLSACVLGPMLILLLPLMAGLGSPRRHSARGRGAASLAVVRPTAADIAGLRRQIQFADYFLAQRYAGARLRGTTTDLALLQRLLDDRWPGSDREIMLRCTSAAFGNVLSQDPDLGWVVVDDRAGRDLGLQSRTSSLVVFSLTMISKRVQDGEAVDLRKLYSGIRALAEPREREADPERASVQSTKV